MPLADVNVPLPMSSRETEDFVQVVLAGLGPFKSAIADVADVTLSARHYFELIKNIHDLETQLSCEQHVASMKEEGPRWLRSRLELIGFLQPGTFEYGGPFEDAEEVLRAAHHYFAKFMGVTITPEPNEAKFLARRFPEQPAVTKPSLPLNEYMLHTRVGRIGFLTAFAKQGAGMLLVSVNHVWLSLAEPQSVRCCLMAQKLGLPGSGKLALRRVLEQFLGEAAGPNLHLAVDKYEQILNGRPKRKTAQIVKGPWRA